MSSLAWILHLSGTFFDQFSVSYTLVTPSLSLHVHHQKVLTYLWDYSDSVSFLLSDCKPPQGRDWDGLLIITSK